MRKLLLLAAVVAGSLLAGATAPLQRSTSTHTGMLKEINRLQHNVTPRQSVKKVVGEAPANTVEVPFTHDIGKAGTEVKNYTIINVNKDNRLWQVGAVSGYGACMVPNDAAVDNNDDWLFTVPIHLPAGEYVVSFEIGMMGTGATAVEMNVSLGTAPTVEAASTVVTPTTKYTDKTMTKHEHNVVVAEEGYYYLGFHCTTAKSMKGTLKLANVGMRAGHVDEPVQVDPPAAGTLTYTLAPKGELKATIQYTAPTLTKSGKPLEKITKVEITSRWGVDKFTYDNVTPGQVITVENVDMYQGINNRFTGVAYVDNVAGAMVEHKSIYCGADTPLAPANVKLAVNDDYTSATLSWDAVSEVGEHGGYVNPDSVIYYVFDAFGTVYDPAVATSTTSSCTLDFKSVNYQDFYAFQVTAGNGELYSLDGTSNIIVAGKPDALPKLESFTGGLYDDMWLGNTAVKGSMQYGTVTDKYFESLIDPEDPDAPTPLKSQDGDGGFYYWMPIDKDAAYGLISTRADISKASKPVLEFWYQGQGSIIEVYAGHELGDLELAISFDLKAKPTSDWTLASVPLDAYKAKGAVMFEIRFVAAHNDDEHTWSVPVDNIRVRDLDATDVRLVNLLGTTKAKPGEMATFKGHVENLSTLETVPVAVWSINGEEIARETLPATAPNAFVDAELYYTVPYNAPAKVEMTLTIQVEGDSISANNSLVAELIVPRVPYPTVNDLTATPQGSSVNLSWTAPATDSAGPVTVTEDFESSEYTPMPITGAGDWTVYDGDGKKTYNMFRETYNPFQTQPMAFQLFDNVVAQVPDQYIPDAVAHSGQRFMIAPSAQSAANDNWLISPLLSGNAQTVSFYAKSFTTAWPETLEVYFSTSDNTRNSMTNLVPDVTGLVDFNGDKIVDEQWSKLTFAIPQGAKYFAIHHNSNDTYGLLVDDITYEAAPTTPADLALNGYYIFRDGMVVTPEPVTGVAFTDHPVADETVAGNYEFNYTIVPVYNYGVADVSNVANVQLEVSGVDNVTVDGNQAPRYFNLQGVAVDGKTMPAGVYIRLQGNTATKVIIK